MLGRIGPVTKYSQTRTAIVAAPTNTYQCVPLRGTHTDAFYIVLGTMCTAYVYADDIMGKIQVVYNR